jgi:hypothetical protein
VSQRHNFKNSLLEISELPHIPMRKAIEEAGILEIECNSSIGNLRNKPIWHA